MPKHLVYLLIFALANSFSSCKKKEEKDESKPVVTLNGKDLDWVYYPKQYNDPGVTAIDDVDGDISSKAIVVNGIDYSTPNLAYPIDYTAKDEAGNLSNSVARIVMHIQLTTGYSSVTNGGVAGSMSWNEDVKYHVGDSLTFEKFASFLNGHVKAIMTNDTVFTIAAQTVICGTPVATAKTFSGEGTLTHARSGPSIRTTIQINYTQVEGGTTTNGTITCQN